MNDIRERQGSPHARTTANEPHGLSTRATEPGCITRCSRESSTYTPEVRGSEGILFFFRSKPGKSSG